MYSLFNEGAEQLYSEEGALVKSPREEGGLCCAESWKTLLVQAQLNRNNLETILKDFR